MVISEANKLYAGLQFEIANNKINEMRHGSKLARHSFF